MLHRAHRDEKELFSRIAAGEEPAFRALFERYKEKIYRFVFHLINSESEAEELVQDIFIRIWTSRHRLKDIDNPGVYIFVIAKNLSLDYIRKRASEYEMKKGFLATIPMSNLSTQEDFDLLQSTRLIKSAVHELPGQQALVFRLSKEEGLKRHEIAARLNISENTVRNHLAEAVKSIRQYLDKHGEFAVLLVLWTIL